jgi:hypothetical protein
MRSDIKNTVIAIHPDVSSLKTSNYTITADDYYVGVGVLTGSITITLPLLPENGDQYVVKDIDGYAGTFPIIVSGNGLNVDGSSSITIAQNYASFTFTYTGNQWSISVGYAGIQNGNGFGIFANRPVQGQAGRTFYAADQAVFYYDDGNAWNAIGPRVSPVVFPISTNYSWVNQGITSVADTGSGMYLQTLGTNGGGRDARLLVQSAPATSYGIDVCFEYVGATTIAANNGLVGVCFRESSSGKIHAYVVDFNSNGDCVMISTKYDSPSSYNSDYNNKVSDFVAGIMWLRISDDGINRYCWYSRDGINYTNFHFVSRTDYITADQIGVFVDPIYQDIKVSYVSWKQTS